MNVNEIQLLLAAPQASSGYSVPGSVYNSLGKWASTTQLNAAVPMNNLFPDTTGPQNAVSMTDYQCVFVYNTDSTDAMKNVFAWIPVSSVVGPLEWAVGADTTGATSFNSVLQQAGYISAPTIAPATVNSWFGPCSLPSQGAQLPNIGPGQVAALWVRRAAVNSAAFAGDVFNLQVTFDA